MVKLEADIIGNVNNYTSEKPGSQSQIVASFIKKGQEKEQKLIGMRAIVEKKVIVKEPAWPQIGDSKYENNKLYKYTATGWVEE